MLAAAPVQALGDVEPYQQIENYSCGAATLKAVMQHWGERAPERKLITEIGIDPNAGSTALQVASAAQRRGYTAAVISFPSIDALKTFTDQDVPVILAIQSFTRPNQGHFVVATDVDEAVDIMDPNVNGNRRRLSRRELDRRWRFRDRVGLVVVPKKVGQRMGLGQTDTTVTTASSHRTTYIVAGVVGVLAAATTIGVVLYRRKRA